MRDLREVRMAKMRKGVGVLEGGKEVNMNGVGGMEVAEGRAFVLGVVDGLRYVFPYPFPFSYLFPSFLPCLSRTRIHSKNIDPS